MHRSRSPVSSLTVGTGNVRWILCHLLDTHNWYLKVFENWLLHSSHNSSAWGEVVVAVTGGTGAANEWDRG